MDYAIPVAWRSDRRGFWTRRKRTAIALALVLAILVGVAVAFKLFDQVVPNNVVRDTASFSFQVWKYEPAAGDSQFEQAGPTQPIYQSHTDPPGSQPINQFPGDTREVTVKVINTNTQPPRDASFAVFVDAIQVRDATGVAPADPVLANLFLSFWSLGVDKEDVLQAGTGSDTRSRTDVANEDDHGILGGTPNADPHPAPDTYQRPRAISFSPACNAPLTQITRVQPCKLGLVRSAGSRDLLGGRTDQRLYIFKLTESEQGDQTRFKGWTVTFNLVFQARVPAEPETPATPVVNER